MSTAEAGARWSSRLSDLAEESRVAGAVLGIWADGHETVATHGVLNTATQAPVTADSLFQVGSITKTWTASMIMQLVDEGRLSLADTVAELLPGVRLGSADASGDVTVRHLLTHTSGIDGDIFTDTGRGDDCVERYVGQLADAPQTHPVGAAYSYCNSGFVVLGRIIEVLDQRGWDESLRRRLVEPLGLTETVTLPEQAILHRAAVGHRERPHEHDPVPTWQLPRSIGPAGLITAGVHDVLQFARLHLDGGVTPAGRQVLSEQSVQAMREPQFAIPSVGERDDAIGLAWRLNRWSGRRIFGHDGGTVGQLAYLRVDPQARVAVCLLTNASASQLLYQRLFSEVFGEYPG
ncbi:MAG: serine hydrolase domain-containing protein, partial [Nocardioidaceae bacterium]